MEVFMGNDKEEEREKGFIVKDKRFTAKKEEDSQSKEEVKREEVPTKEEGSDKEGTLPEITFASFVFSLSTSALVQLGEIQDPMTKQFSKHFALAKQTIDLIAMLRDKTKGNLTPDEERLIETILYDLRMRYVKAAP
jgi:hypothetical protein